MTNREAIEILTKAKLWLTVEKNIEAFDKAIEALKTVEKLKENEDDGK